MRALGASRSRKMAWLLGLFLASASNALAAFTCTVVLRLARMRSTSGLHVHKTPNNDSDHHHGPQTEKISTQQLTVQEGSSLSIVTKLSFDLFLGSTALLQLDRAWGTWPKLASQGEFFFPASQCRRPHGWGTTALITHLITYQIIQSCQWTTALVTHLTTYQIIQSCQWTTALITHLIIYQIIQSYQAT